MKMPFLLKTNFWWFAAVLLALAACHPAVKKNVTQLDAAMQFTLFSRTVKDSFYISVQLPQEYRQQPKKRYPVVVLTDANFFYPMLAPVLHQYEKGGLLQPVILVGIGYKSFEAMNALRVRDYLYPKAISSDEMKAPGGGQHFYQFITTELLPVIDRRYRTTTTNRALLGHSFGGYFSLYALLEQLNTRRNDFKGFISASPSLWYNHNYLFRLPQKLRTAFLKDSLYVCLSVGSLEDSKWAVQPVKDFSRQLSATMPAVQLNLSTQVYPDLDHMDVGMISFIKGLELMYNQPGR